MKLLNYSFLAVMLAFTVSSCTKDEVDYIRTEQDQNDQNFELFLQSLDSLNLTYSSRTRATEVQQHLDYDPVDLGPGNYSIRNVGTVCASDFAGRLVGRYGGQWVGGFLGGALTGGNPIGTIAGTWIGKKYGSKIGGTIASAIAKELIYGYQISTGQSIQGNSSQVQIFVYNTALTSTDCDSLGYYHNLVMCTVLNDPLKYIDNDNIVNVNQLYDDVIDCLSDLLGFDATLYSDTLTKQYFIEQIKIFHANGLEFVNGSISYDKLLEKNEDVLVRNFNIDATIARKSTRIASSVFSEIVALDEEQTQRYAEDLNNVIENSSLSKTDRELVRGNSEILINSKLCWVANK